MPPATWMIYGKSIPAIGIGENSVHDRPVYFFSFLDTTVSFLSRRAAELRSTLSKIARQCGSAKNQMSPWRCTPYRHFAKRPAANFSVEFSGKYSGQRPRIASLILRQRRKIPRRSRKFSARQWSRRPAGIRGASGVEITSALAARRSIPERVVKKSCTA